MAMADASYDLANAFGSTLDVFEDETTIPRRKKRRSSARRVSFAEIQTVHVFPRDEEYATPPGAALEGASPQPVRKSPRLAAKKRSPMAEVQAEDTGTSTENSKTEAGDEATGPVDINHIVQVCQGSPFLEDDITLDSTEFSAKLMKFTDETRAIEHGVQEDNVKLPRSWESAMSFASQNRPPLSFVTDSPATSLSMQCTEMVDAAALFQRRRRVFGTSPRLKEKENVSPPSSANPVILKKPSLETPISRLKRRITYISEGKENTPTSASATKEIAETSNFLTLASPFDRDVTETSKDITIIGEVPALGSDSIVDSIVDRETTQETTGVPTLLHLLDRDTTTFDETPLQIYQDSNSPVPTEQKKLNVSNTPVSTNQKMAGEINNSSTPVSLVLDMVGEVNVSNTPVPAKQKLTGELNISKTPVSQYQVSTPKKMPGEVHISYTPLPTKEKLAGEVNVSKIPMSQHQVSTKQQIAEVNMSNTPVPAKQKLAGEVSTSKTPVSQNQVFTNQKMAREVDISSTPVPAKQKMAGEVNITCTPVSKKQVPTKMAEVKLSNSVPPKQKMDGKLKLYFENLKRKTETTKLLYDKLKKETEAMKACHDILKKLHSRAQQVQNRWADKRCLSEESSKKELARNQQELQAMRDKNEQMRATMTLLDKRLQDLSVVKSDCKREHSKLQLLQRMQGWHITRLASERDAHWLDISYGYRVNQSLTIQGLVPLSCAITVTPNLQFIEKGFPRMNANLLFQALIPEGKYPIKQLKSIPVAMQQTSDLVMNLIQVAKEARDCRVQHRCLVSVVFVNHKDHGICLQFEFENYRMRLRITLVFSLQSLINGLYPRDIIPCELLVDSTRRTQTVVTEQDLSNAICSLPAGYQRFHRTCACVANFLP